jgi:hypothetical protein
MRFGIRQHLPSADASESVAQFFGFEVLSVEHNLSIAVYENCGGPPIDAIGVDCFIFAVDQGGKSIAIFLEIFAS